MQKKISYWITVSCLVASFGLCNMPLAFANEPNNEENKAELTKKQLAQVNEAIVKLQEDLGKDKQFQQKEQNALKEIEIELSKLHKKSLSLDKQQKTVKQHITALEKEKNILTEKNQQQQQALNHDLRAIYKIGKQEKLKLLLNQENPENLARILKYYDYYTEARVERILSYKNTIADLELKRVEIEKELANLQSIEISIAEEASKLKKNQTERQKIVDGITKNIATKDQELKNLQANQAQLTKLLRSLQGIWADIPNKLSKSSFKKRKGTLNHPVHGTIKYRFGSQRAEGRMEWHGWFISTDMNKPVNAIHDGRVVFSDWIRGYGLMIIIDHSDGYLSLYGHNASLLKEAGDWISEGEALATVGNSGGQQETGLYFELRHDGEPLNPKSWLKK